MPNINPNTICHNENQHQNQTPEFSQIGGAGGIEGGMLLVIPLKSPPRPRSGTASGGLPEACPQAEVCGGLEMFGVADCGTQRPHYCDETENETKLNTISSGRSGAQSEGHGMFWGQSRPQCPQAPVPLLPLGRTAPTERPDTSRSLLLPEHPIPPQDATHAETEISARCQSHLAARILPQYTFQFMGQ